MQSDYHFWQDLFDTYQSLSDWVKLAWIASPVALCIIAIWMRSLNLRGKEEFSQATIPPGELVYTIRRGEEGSLVIYRHADKSEHELLLEEF